MEPEDGVVFALPKRAANLLCQAGPHEFDDDRTQVAMADWDDILWLVQCPAMPTIRRTPVLDRTS